MTTPSLAFGPPTLADRLVGRGLGVDVVLIASGAGLTSIAAQLVIPLWPVPITGQTFAVLLVGAMLGPIRASLSMALYLVLGVAGLPVFAEGRSGSLVGLPSGGYIVGFIIAAALVGWLAQREWDRRLLGTTLAFLIGTLVIYAIGVPWLYLTISALSSETMIERFGTTSAFQASLIYGLAVFIPGDIIKAVAAGLLLPLAWRHVRAV